MFSLPGILLIVLIVSLVILFLPNQTLENTRTENALQGEIVAINTSSTTHFEQREYTQQELEIRIENKTIPVSSNLILKNSPQMYEVGDRVLVGQTKGTGVDVSYFLIGYDRSQTIFILIGLFLLVVFLVGKSQGIKAIISMLFSFLVIFKIILPQIIRGENPLLISILGVLVIIPISFALTHGINKKSISAGIGTIASLLLIGVLTTIVIYSAKLTGITSEEIETLFYASQGTYDLSSLLIAGIVIGALGILDDVTVSQASVVTELLTSNKTLSSRELFSKAMVVGRDHIASVINTLILVYTGAFLSTLLLFLTFPRPFIVLLNDETVVIQIVIALVGSIGLILAVPITTLLTIRIHTKKQ